MAFTPQATETTSITVTTPTSIVASPGSGIRMVNRLSLFNPSNQKHTIQVEIAGQQAWGFNLSAGETWVYPGETIMLDNTQDIKVTTNRTSGLNASASYADKT